jgi:hypothetical protein
MSDVLCKNCIYYKNVSNELKCKIPEHRLYEIAKMELCTNEIIDEAIIGLKTLDEFKDKYQQWQQVTGKEKCNEEHYIKVCEVNYDNDCPLYKPLSIDKKTSLKYKVLNKIEKIFTK